jgi:hypothetical protein
LEEKKELSYVTSGVASNTLHNKGVYMVLSLMDSK